MTLGVGGIVIVLMAVVCALGIFGYAGVTTTLLTIEVSRAANTIAQYPVSVLLCTALIILWVATCHNT